ncbi:nucleotide-binding oligomerization domain-containing protein 2-like [Montipora foliosa]|uniref:nucleotide-binding oligomerization domain-containing protein 2-like n=1 Tax=Montipora foliosa TaxID=591990 RepID=UPI0035F1C00F
MASAPLQQSQELGSNKVQVTILASEWGSSKGGLSTINRELAIQLAKFPEVQITYFLPKCSEEDRKVALSYGIQILEATGLPGFDELEKLSFPPEHLRIDVIVGHGVKLGRQAQVIRNSRECKWIQVIHTDPEELGMFKSYENPISRGEEKHIVEVELCKMANFVVGVGPKIAEAFRKYLRSFQKDEDVFEFTPGVFDEFVRVKQVPEERKQCSVLVLGHGDAKDFELKGFDIAARSVAALPDTLLLYVGAPNGKHEEIANRLLKCGVPKRRLRVRGYIETRERLKELFCEMDLVLMPSRTEGFGLTGLEALSAGLPVIVSKNSGFGEALCNVPFGSSFVIDSEDPTEWTAGIKGIWNKNRKTRLDEAKVLRDSYGEKYSWSKQCNDLLQRIIKTVNDAPRELQIPQEAKGRLKSKSREDQKGISFTDHELSQQKARVEEEEFKQHSASSLCQSEIIERIRQIYRKREGVVLPVPWCEGFILQLENIFTRLRIVAKEKKRGTLTKEITNMTGIFTSHKDCKHPRIVLIEGEPGMGKTAFCQKLAYDWATKRDREWDESFPRVEVLLLLKCREIDSSIWEAIDNQILPKDIDPELKETFFGFVRENPSEVLLVLDGLDEANPQKWPDISILMQRKLLPGCHVVLTSRPEAGSKVRSYTDTLLEIAGFTKSDAKCFIRKYFQDAGQMAEKLIKVLWHPSYVFDGDVNDDDDDDDDDDNDGDVNDDDDDDDDDNQQHIELNLKELTKNPLHTLLLCAIFEDFGGVLPKNRTELYLEIVLFVLRRYEVKNHLPGSGEDLLSVYKKELMTLGTMALKSLCTGELHFKDVEGNFKESLFIKFGFLSIQAGGSKGTRCFLYSFFHKSFQEFFSGLYLAFSILDGGIDKKSVLTDERFFGQLNQVFMFMSGIIALQSEETAMSLVSSILSLANLEVRRSLGKQNSKLLLALALIEECQPLSEDLYTKLADNFGRNLDLTEIDFSMLFNNIRITTLSLALAVNSTLTKLILFENSIGSEGATSLSRALIVNTSLATLDLSRNSIGSEGASSLSQALKENFSLTTLHLSWNSIGDEGATSLSYALKENTSLTTLRLSYNSIGDEGATSLSCALKENTSLTTLHLSYNSIGVEGATSLYQALAVNNSLTSLDLYGNPLGVEGDEFPPRLSLDSRINVKR